MIFIRRNEHNVYMSADLVKIMPNFTVGIYYVGGVRHIAFVETNENNDEKIAYTLRNKGKSNTAYIPWTNLAEMLPEGKRIKGIYYKQDKAIVFKLNK